MKSSAACLSIVFVYVHLLRFTLPPAHCLMFNVMFIALMSRDRQKKIIAFHIIIYLIINMQYNIYIYNILFIFLILCFILFIFLYITFYIASCPMPFPLFDDHFKEEKRVPLTIFGII